VHEPALPPDADLPPLVLAPAPPVAGPAVPPLAVPPFPTAPDVPAVPPDPTLPPRAATPPVPTEVPPLPPLPGAGGSSSPPQAYNARGNHPSMSPRNHTQGRLASLESSCNGFARRGQPVFFAARCKPLDQKSRAKSSPGAVACCHSDAEGTGAAERAGRHRFRRCLNDHVRRGPDVVGGGLERARKRGRRRTVPSLRNGERRRRSRLRWRCG
jgi:hypothetical protein